ncbi:MAG: hypothetical protein ACOCWQ_02020 [Nanoarchaeota archaeon]
MGLGQIVRRTATTACLGMALLAATLSQSAHAQQPAQESSLQRSTEMTYANRLLTQFPDTLPKAHSVRKYMTPGAKYTLVHVRQVHQGKDGSTSESVACQNEIYDILSALADKGMRDVYFEGVDQKEYEKLVRQCRKFQGAREEFAGAAGEEKVEAEAQRVLNDWKRQHSPVALYFEGRIRLHPAENTETWEESNATIEGIEQRYRKQGNVFLSRSDPVVQELSYQSREDYLLRKVMKDNIPLAVVVYGADHSWGGKESFPDFAIGKRIDTCDNIARHNEQYPDARFSLIEVVPETVPACMDAVDAMYRAQRDSEAKSHAIGIVGAFAASACVAGAFYFWKRK